MKTIGIFLDHSCAMFINPVNGNIEKAINNELSGHERIPGETTDGTKTGKISSSNNEYNRHHRKQQALANYYRKIADSISEYDKVYLIGPTTARHELTHYIQNMRNHSKLQLESETTDYMSQNQLVAKVKKHFS